MTFLFDENLSPRQAARLRALGYDAIAITDVGFSGASDPVIRSNAMAMNRVLVTLDADFGNILRYPVLGTPGVIWLRLHPPTEEAISGALDRVINRLRAQGLEGKLVVVDEDKIRIRGSA